MKKSIILSFTALMLTLLGITKLFLGHSSVYRIAILTPTTHPSLELIEKGFIETLSKSNPGAYSFKTYNAQGNKTLMRSEVDEIARKGYDLVFTIGANTTQMSKEVFAKKGNRTPIVFTAVTEPMNLNIIQSEESSGNQITGVKEMTDFKKEINLMRTLNQDIKTILLVYDPTQYGLARDKDEIEHILAGFGIRLIPLEVFKTNELLQKVSMHIKEADALLVLKDNTVVPGLDVLVKMSLREKIPLIASDLDSVEKGAAAAFGVSEYIYGEEAALKARQILEDKKPPSQIPITGPRESSYQTVYNKGLLEELGIEIPNESKP